MATATATTMGMVYVCFQMSEKYTSQLEIGLVFSPGYGRQQCFDMQSTKQTASTEPATILSVTNNQAGKVSSSCKWTSAKGTEKCL